MTFSVACDLCIARTSQLVRRYFVRERLQLNVASPPYGQFFSNIIDKVLIIPSLLESWPAAFRLILARAVVDVGSSLHLVLLLRVMEEVVSL